MKTNYSTHLPVLCVLLMASGCATNSTTVLKPDGDRKIDMRPGVLKSYPEEIMFISSSGEKVGFSARELIDISEDYIETAGLRKSINGDKPRIWINTDGKNKLADIYYHGIEKWRSLIIEIDKDGKVIRHQIVDMVCGNALEK